MAANPAAPAAEPADPSADPTDVELVGQIGEGRRDALAELYERHAGWLTIRLQRRCSDADLVDTALQDTFLAVWRQAADYRPTGDVGAWLWTIAVRRLIDQLRRRPPPEPVADVALLRPFAAVIADEIPLALGHTGLGTAFMQLEPDLQAVMAATALDGLTNAEAGALLNIPTGTVKSRLARARQALQALLQETPQ